ncbi:hypothetical protein D9602_13705 [Sphingomonas sp. TX0522]|nr:hypothetical protein [Sphingomonas sp. TX0522]
MRRLFSYEPPVEGESLRPPTPSFPRRRESRHATVAPPAARPEVMDSRLRGNDEWQGRCARERALKLP